MANLSVSDKKPHVCPPSDATHPRDRWETHFVYSFICKFTNLRHKVEGLETPMDFEEALMSNAPNDILTHVLAHFILNLKPQTRNLSIDLISSTVQSVLGEFLKTTERTVFWDDAKHANVDPFEGSGKGFFSTNWDFKLKILRQLVDLQLTHAPSIKIVIDRAWGIVHNKHKKRELTPPPDPTDRYSRENLQVLPIGQDLSRKRYWIADDSPRVWTSTNPWKTTASFQAVSTTRDDYIALIDTLKEQYAPAPKKNHRPTKVEQGHASLIETLENRIEAIDAELARVARARKRIEQRYALLAQAELRTTRTRRQTQKPDYVYSNGYDSADDADEYEDEMEDDDSSSGSRKRKPPPSAAPTRRSGRAAVKNRSSTRDSSPEDSWKNWRGERRSTRLGAPPETQLDEGPAFKRARTDDSALGGPSKGSTPPSTNGTTNGVKFKGSGAAALKPTEVAVEQIAGKKKSKFWVYAVEPDPEEPLSMEVDHPVAQNGVSPQPNGTESGVVDASQPPSTVAASSSPQPSDVRAESEDYESMSIAPPAVSSVPMDTT